MLRRLHAVIFPYSRLAERAAAPRAGCRQRQHRPWTLLTHHPSKNHCQCEQEKNNRKYATRRTIYYRIQKKENDRYQKDNDTTAAGAAACAPASGAAASIPALYFILYKSVTQIYFSIMIPIMHCSLRSPFRHQWQWGCTVPSHNYLMSYPAINHTPFSAARKRPTSCISFHRYTIFAYRENCILF